MILNGQRFPLIFKLHLLITKLKKDLLLSV